MSKRKVRALVPKYERLVGHLYRQLKGWNGQDERASKAMRSWFRHAIRMWTRNEVRRAESRKL